MELPMERNLLAEKLHYINWGEKKGNIAESGVSSEEQ